MKKDQTPLKWTGGDGHGDRAPANIEFIEPQYLRDFPSLEGMWVPTNEYGTHGAFAYWSPLGRGVNACQVFKTEEGCRNVCSGREIPKKISHKYPVVAIMPTA